MKFKVGDKVKVISEERYKNIKYKLKYTYIFYKDRFGKVYKVTHISTSQPNIFLLLNKKTREEVVMDGDALIKIDHLKINNKYFEL